MFDGRGLCLLHQSTNLTSGNLTLLQDAARVKHHWVNQLQVRALQWCYPHHISRSGDYFACKASCRRNNCN